MEVRLDVLEDSDGAISTSTTENQSVSGWTKQCIGKRLDTPEGTCGLDGGGDTDGVVESETERLVHLFSALASVEQVCLDVIKDGEEHAARLMGSDVAISAGDALRDSRCMKVSLLMTR